jgi:hypothetical protein
VDISETARFASVAVQLNVGGYNFATFGEFLRESIIVDGPRETPHENTFCLFGRCGITIGKLDFFGWGCGVIISFAFAYESWSVSHRSFKTHRRADH